MSNRTFDIMLNPRASFYLNQHGSGFAVSISLDYSRINFIFFQPVNPSHHVIDAIFIPDETNWYLLYTEQRNGHGYIWRQKFNQIFESNHRLQNNATQVCMKIEF